jgi:N-methylhydantoinase B
MQDMAPPAPRFDAIAMEVFSNRLLSITEEMAINMMRSSFSTQIKERRDFSVGLFDARGRLLSQGLHIPLHLGSLMGAMQALLQHYDLATLAEGDAFICNDTYVAGGTHLPDISIITPVFHGGRLVAFAGNIGHHSDVGGVVPGSISAKARTIYEEGLRIPLIRIATRGQVNEDLLRLIALNSRLEEERALDLRVQIATNDRGAATLRALIDQMGLAKVETAIEDILSYTARRLRLRIRELPPGAYGFTTWLDDDGNGGEPVPLTVTVHVDGDRLLFDLTGSGQQARGALNVSESALKATIYYCVKALLDPELMPNSGMFDAIEIAAPPGTIVNPRHPGASGARSIACQKIAGAVFGAFRAILPPERIMGNGNDILPSISFSGTDGRGGADRYYVCGEALGGGSGARFDSDGMSGIHVHVTNSLNLPSEALEHEFPLMVERYGLVVDSGGAGRQRGGLGILREVRALAGQTIFSARSDSHKRGSAGAAGGADGGTGRMLRNAGTAGEEVMESKIAHLVLEPGETMRIETPGGGGYGPPAARDPAALAADLEDGIVTEAAARRDYGAALTEAALGLIRGARQG